LSPEKRKASYRCGLRAFGVRYSDQLPNFGIIPDYLKVVDFIEEMEYSTQFHPTV
jgi:hypothetical protein